MEGIISTNRIKDQKAKNLRQTPISPSGQYACRQRELPVPIDITSGLRDESLHNRSATHIIRFKPFETFISVQQTLGVSMALV